MMKKILSIISFIFIFTNCKAQILDISADVGQRPVAGTYYKDMHGYLDPFIGTYVYSDGTTMLKIVLQKKIMATVANGHYHEDLIVGEYQYIENGVEKINTLNELGTHEDNAWKYTINGNFLLIGQALGCTECDPTERRLRLGLSNSVIDNFAELDVRKIEVNEQSALKIRWSWAGRSRLEGTTLPPPPVPDGDYILLLQP